MPSIIYIVSIYPGLQTVHLHYMHQVLHLAVQLCADHDWLPTFDNNVPHVCRCHSATQS